MENKVNFYTLGRDIAIKKKFPSKRLFSKFNTAKELDYKSLIENIDSLYSYLVNEYEKKPRDSSVIFILDFR